MGRKKTFLLIIAITMIGAGFLTVTAMAGDKPHLGPKILNIKWVGFPGDGRSSFTVDPVNGCIENFYYENGKRIMPEDPGWLPKGKRTVDFRSFTDLQCRQGVIGIGGSPIEYWGYANGSYYCIGAWDPACPAWYQPCRDSYPNCD